MKKVFANNLRAGDCIEVFYESSPNIPYSARVLEVVETTSKTVRLRLLRRGRVSIVSYSMYEQVNRLVETRNDEEDFARQPKPDTFNGYPIS